MKTHCFGTAGLCALLGLVGACSANIHDNTINIPGATINAMASADVDVQNIAPAEQVPVMVTLNDKVFLVEPTAAPPAGHETDAGHIQVYMDDTSKPPILVTAVATFNVTIPADTKAGNHKLICRVHKHETNAPTNIVAEINIVVKVTGTPGDASVTVEFDANTSTGTGGAAGTGGATGAGGASGTGGATAVGGAGGGAGGV